MALANTHTEAKPSGPSIPHDDRPDDCPFLDRLPVELRMQVYEYVLGGNVIHISRARETVSSTCGQPKVIAVVCHAPGSEKDAYSLSQVFDQADLRLPGYMPSTSRTVPKHELVSHPEFLSSYADRHDLCHEISESFQQNKYVDRNRKLVQKHTCHLDPADNESLPDPCRCVEFHGKARFGCANELYQSHGFPRDGGLDRLYPHAKYDLSLLRACKQISTEAQLVPFYANTFAIPARRGVLRNFAEHFLDLRQRASVQAVQLLAGGLSFAELLEETVEAFGSLQVMDMTLWDDRLKHLKDCQIRRCVERASVTIGVDDPRSDGIGALMGSKRKRRREKGKVVEKLLMTSERIEEAEWAVLSAK